MFFEKVNNKRLLNYSSKFVYEAVMYCTAVQYCTKFRF